MIFAFSLQVLNSVLSELPMAMDAFCFLRGILTISSPEESRGFPYLRLPYAVDPMHSKSGSVCRLLCLAFHTDLKGNMWLAVCVKPA